MQFMQSPQILPWAGSTPGLLPAPIFSLFIIATRKPRTRKAPGASTKIFTGTYAAGVIFAPNHVPAPIISLMEPKRKRAMVKPKPMPSPSKKADTGFILPA